MHLGYLNVRKGILSVLIPVLRWLPPRAGTRLVALLGKVEFAVNRPLRARYKAALRRGARHFGSQWNVRQVGSDLAGNLVRWRARDLLLDGLSNEQAAPLFEVQGREYLDAAYGQRRGVILLFNHFGAFLMPAHWLVREGYPLRWFTERPRHISRMVERTFQGDGPLSQEKLFMSRKAGPSEGGVAIRRAVRILQAGLIVQIAGDVRGTGPRAVPAEFLGRQYTFTTTWVALAARTGAPVVPVFCWMERDGSYHLEFQAHFIVPAEVSRTASYRPWVQDYLGTIEAQVARHPENSGDYFFWAESDQYAVA